jgi:hypothetical protein
MGYTTDFSGEFTVTPPLTPEHKAYLEKFAETRRMKRDEAVTASRPDPLREAVGLPIGREGGFFVNEEGLCGQGKETDRHPREDRAEAGILEYNQPPAGQPGLWCQWVPNEDGTAIVWDEGEKFYHYIEWLEYMIDKFLRPWGYTLNGSVNWFGESSDDRGIIRVENNEIDSAEDEITNRLA